MEQTRRKHLVDATDNSKILFNSADAERASREDKRRVLTIFPCKYSWRSSTQSSTIISLNVTKNNFSFCGNKTWQHTNRRARLHLKNSINFFVISKRTTLTSTNNIERFFITARCFDRFSRSRFTHSHPFHFCFNQNLKEKTEQKLQEQNTILQNTSDVTSPPHHDTSSSDIFCSTHYWQLPKTSSRTRSTETNP